METPATYKTALWLPYDVQNTNVVRFINFVNQKHGLRLQTYDDLHAWSVGRDSMQDFWQEAYIFFELASSGGDGVGKMLHYQVRRFLPGYCDMTG